MLDVITITLPIYLVIALGFVTVKTGVIDDGIIDYLVQFVVKLALPLLVFLAITTAGHGSILIPELMISYGILILGFLFAGQVLLRHVFYCQSGPSWSLALGAANPNTIMVGFPLALIMFPDHAASIFASLLLVENVTAIPLSLLMAEVAGRNSRGFSAVMKDFLTSVSKNMILIAVVIALLSRAAGYAPSGPIEGAIRLVGQTATGLALFYIGAVCTRSALVGPIGVVSVIALLKLVAMPIAAAILFPFILDDPALVKAAIIFTAMPMLAIYPMLCRQSGSEQIASTVLIVTTTLSFVTVSIGLLVL